jgi:transposase
MNRLEIIADLQDKNRALTEENERLRAQVQTLQAENGTLLRQLVGPKKEPFDIDDDQPELESVIADAFEETKRFIDEHDPDDDEASEYDAPTSTSAVAANDADDGFSLSPSEVEAAKKPKKRKKNQHKHGRMNLEALEGVLDVQDVYVKLNEADQVCPVTGTPLTLTDGQVITRKLEIEPQKIIIKRYIRERCISPDAMAEGEDFHVTLPQLPPCVIHKSLMGEGLMADLLVSKYLDHTPYYRRSKMIARHGFELSRQTMSGITLTLALDVLMPLYDLHMRSILSADYVFMDDTRFKVQEQYLSEEQRQDLGSSRMWVYGSIDPHQVAYVFTLNRSNDSCGDILSGYEGFVQADAYSAHDIIFRENARALEVGCMAHMRRKFYESLDSAPSEAELVLVVLRRLWRLEEAATKAQFSESQRLAMRQAQSKPLVEALWKEMKGMKERCLPSSKIGQALTYAINQEQALQRFLVDGRIRLDNNLAEQAMRPIALARNNYYGCGSERGGRAAAIILSLGMSCELLGINAWVYFRDILRRLPTIADDPAQLTQLLPINWQEGPPEPSTVYMPALPRPPVPVIRC